MDLQQAIAGRRMTRRFDPERPVPTAVLDTALRLALRAPNAGFSQGWDFVVLTEPGDRERFWSATTDSAAEPDAWLRGVRAAPALVVCCSDPQSYLDRYAEADKPWQDKDAAHWPVPYWDVDTGMAALIMLLVAQDAELGGLFFGVPVERLDAVRSALSIPHGRNVVGVVALGYPAPRGSGHGSPRRRERRPADEVLHAGRFGVPYRPT